MPSSARTRINCDFCIHGREFWSRGRSSWPKLRSAFLSPEPRLAPRRWARAMCGKLVTRRRPASSSAAVPNDGGLWTILHRGEASVLAKPAALEHVQSRALARSKRIVQPVKLFHFAADYARYSLQTSTKGTGPRIFGRRRPIVSSSTHENESRKCYLFVAANP